MTDKDYVIKEWNIRHEGIYLDIIFKNDIFHGFAWRMRLGFDYLSGDIIFPSSPFGYISSEVKKLANIYTKEEIENFYKELLAYMDITEYEYHNGDEPYCIISLDAYRNVLTLWKLKGRC